MDTDTTITTPPDAASSGNVADAAAKVPTVMRAVAAIMEAPEDSDVVDAIPREYVDAFDPDVMLTTLMVAAMFAEQAGFVPEQLHDWATRTGDDAIRAMLGS